MHFEPALEEENNKYQNKIAHNIPALWDAILGGPTNT